MRTLLIVFIGVMLLLPNGHLLAQDGPLRLSSEWTGYYQDEEGRLMIIKEDFFFLDDLLSKGGYYEKIDKLGTDEVHLTFKEYDHQTRVPTLKLKKEKDHLLARYDHYQEFELKLKKYNPTSNTKGIEKELGDFNGEWFCGDDDLVVKIDFNKVTIEDQSYQIDDAFQFFREGKHFNYFLLKGTAGGQFLRNPSQLNNNYLSLTMLGRNYEHCRKIIDIPLNASDLYDELPINLLGKWNEKEQNANQLIFNEDYTLVLDGKTHRISRLDYPYKDAPITLKYKNGDDDVRIELSAAQKDRIVWKDTETNELRVFLREGSLVQDTVEVEEAENEGIAWEFWLGLLLGTIAGALFSFIIRAKKKNDFV